MVKRIIQIDEEHCTCCGILLPRQAVTLSTDGIIPDSSI